VKAVIILELGETTTPDEATTAIADLQDLGYDKIRLAEGPIAAQILESINPPKR
jgi:hypothetical protein